MLDVTNTVVISGLYLYTYFLGQMHEYGPWRPVEQIGSFPYSILHSDS